GHLGAGKQDAGMARSPDGEPRPRTRRNTHMSTNTKVKKNDRNAQDQQLIAGIRKRMPNVVLTLLGKTYTEAELVALVQGRVDATNKATASRGAWRGDVKAMRDVVALSRGVLKALKKYLLAVYGEDIEALNDFGLEPEKKGEPPVKVKAEATEKSK